jgi:hypothetical protein
MPIQFISQLSDKGIQAGNQNPCGSGKKVGLTSDRIA